MRHGGICLNLKFYMQGKNVCVVGAGVVGVTTALLAQEKGGNVTIIADKLEKETMSHGMIGLFAPSTSFHVQSPSITKDVIKYSYQYYSKLLEEENAGVQTLTGYFLSKVDQSVVKNHLLEEILLDYRTASEDELALFPGGWKWGSCLTTISIENRFYLPWAIKRFTKLGGSIVRVAIQSFADIKSHGDFDVVFNCTGYGSKQLCNDHKLIAISRQLYNVNIPSSDKFVFAESDTFVIPGHLHTVGGSQHFESYRTQPCLHDGAAIWLRAKTLLPQLQTSEIRRQWIGVYAYRDGGVRVQAEIIDGIKVIHNYGHGQNAVTSAPGTSHLAIQHAEELLKSNKL